MNRVFALLAGILLAMGMGEVVSASSPVVGIRVTCTSADMTTVVHIVCSGKAEGQNTDGLKSVNGVPIDFKPTNKFYAYWKSRVGKDTICRWSNSFNDRKTWTIPINYCDPPITTT